MKCINNTYYRKRRNRKKELRIRIFLMLLLIGCLSGGIALLFVFHNTAKGVVPEKYAKGIYTTLPYADQLCISNKDVECEEFNKYDEFPGALLFDIQEQEVLFSENVHERLYPASTTKMLTAYLALKYGDLDSYVTVSKNAVNVPAASSIAYLKEGDKLTLNDILYALMLPSGNDSAVAIAEHISGNVKDFADLMNQEAKLLGATNTHFVNPHGYHDKNHYTTAYDLYLILNACIKDERFIKIVSTAQKSANITQADGSSRTATWYQTNQFVNGQMQSPKGVSVIGGKTGNTHNAGSCLALYCKNDNETPYIAIIMGATSKRNLYEHMAFLLRAIPSE